MIIRSSVYDTESVFRLDCFFCPVTECTLGEMSLRNSHAETVRLVV